MNFSKYYGEALTPASLYSLNFFVVILKSNIIPLYTHSPYLSINLSYYHVLLFFNQAVKSCLTILSLLGGNFIYSPYHFVKRLSQHFTHLNFDFSNIFMPELEKQYLHINKHRNREYAE